MKKRNEISTLEHHERSGEPLGIKPNQSYLYKFRVSYSDTDQMGFMHHSCYFTYYETARWELFRSCGITYDEIEKEGIILPVINVAIDYKKAALYDQLITIDVKLKYYRGARFIFDYTMTNENNELINLAEITIACVKKDKGIACLPYGKLQAAVSNIEIPDRRTTSFNRNNAKHFFHLNT